MELDFESKPEKSPRRRKKAEKEKGCKNCSLSVVARGRIELPTFGL
jgi:hypothetical protein